MSKRVAAAGGAALALLMLFSFGTSVRAENQSLYTDFQSFASSTDSEAPESSAAPTQKTEKKPEKKSAAQPAQKPAQKQSPGADPVRGTVLLDEKFNGSTLDTSVWNYCHWWNAGGCTIKSNDELEWYTPQQVSVKDGVLSLTAEREDTVSTDGTIFDYASGMVTTGPQQHRQRPKLAFTYGVVDVRFKVPEGQGLWPAIWLLPASEESRPEIDMMEILGHDTDNLRMKLHPKDRSADRVGKKYLLPEGYGFADAWHTLSLDWSEQKLVMYLDNHKVWEYNGAEVPSEPMYLVMNLAVGGGYPGDPDASTKFPATFQIDRVRITSHD